MHAAPRRRACGAFPSAKRHGPPGPAYKLTWKSQRRLGSNESQLNYYNGSCLLSVVPSEHSAFSAYCNRHDRHCSRGSVKSNNQQSSTGRLLLRVERKNEQVIKSPITRSPLSWKQRGAAEVEEKPRCSLTQLLLVHGACCGAGVRAD